MNKSKQESSDSAVEDMTAFMIFAMLRMAPLFGGMSALVDKKKCPPALLRAFGLLWYPASLWTASTMSLALYVSMASSWDEI